MASSEDGHASVSSDPAAYYHSFSHRDIQQGFESLDDAANLDSALRVVQGTATQNFVVDFSDEAACVAFDLQTTAIEVLLETERPDSLSTRWINLWYPYNHGALLETLAKRYDFSPRHWR